MTAALRRAGCILAYDQACVDEACHADRRPAEGAAAFSCGGAIAVDWFDVTLNYGLVAANAMMALNLLRALRERVVIDETIPSILAAGLCFSFVMAFQILLCLAVRCVGVSIVWCATLGWMLVSMKHRKSGASSSSSTEDTPAETSDLLNKQHTRLVDIFQSTRLYLLLGIDAIALVYYAVVAEAITTVAHGCAVILGVVLWRIACKASC